LPELPALGGKLCTLKPGLGGVALSRSRGRLCAAGAIIFWLAACAHAPPPPSFSAFAPSLRLSAVGSTPYAYPEMPGQVLLVSFLATWCFPCIGQLALLEKEQRQHGGRGFRIVAVGMDLEGTEVLEPFALEYRLPFPLLVADDRIHKGQSAFGPIPSLPAAFLFGRDGRLITAFAGLLVPEELDELIVHALEAAPRT